MDDLTHLNSDGRARMVDVGSKAMTPRTAMAQARVLMQPETLVRIQSAKIAKGDVLAVAQVAGILGAKQTPNLIPMCHPLLITSVNMTFKQDEIPNADGLCNVLITAEVKTTGQTGVEMEAMTAVSVAALTIYDMCKAIDRGMTVTDVCLQSKDGGKSGTYLRSSMREHSASIVVGNYDE